MTIEELLVDFKVFYPHLDFTTNEDGSFYSDKTQQFFYIYVKGYMKCEEGVILSKEMVLEQLKGKMDWSYADFIDDVRAAIINVALEYTGSSINKAAKLLKCSRCVIQNILKKG